ncbi:MAG: phage antirepressor KilAC domain-containing protein [Bacillota bacterium]
MKLTLVEKTMIPVYRNENQETIINARELHEFLGSQQEFANWIKNRIEKYGFIEGEDYLTILSNRSDGLAGKPKTDYLLKMDCAKEIAMVENNDQGRKVRKYFIEVEKRAKQNVSQFRVPTNFTEALRLALEQAEQNQILLENNQTQAQIIGELKPKADYTDRILQNKGLVNITQIAKDYGISGAEMNRTLHDLKVQYKNSRGQWLLTAKYHGLGYTHSDTIDFKHSDGRADVKMHTNWTQKGRLFLYDLLKKHDILPVIEIEQAA